MKDADGIPWEMYALLDDVDAETAADSSLRAFLGQQSPTAGSEPACCVPSELGQTREPS